ncbi:MAG: hypothetical protein FJ104_13145 [Deltaproteobacteria bacterium]|nr:hypothetical protein [Deltaproteobacteria bacterium]
MSESTALTADQALALASTERGGEALVADLLAARNAAALAALADRASGVTRKAARRALNVLRSRGVAIPEAARVARVGGTEEEELEAFLLPPDTTGMQVVTVAARSGSGRVRAAVVYLDPALGLARVDNLPLTQSRLRDHLAGLAPGSGLTAVRVPVPFARDRIRVAREAGRARGLAEPLGVTTALPLLEPPPAEPPPHPFDEEGLVLDAEDARELATRSGALHQLPEFRAWLPSASAVQELLVAAGNGLAGGEADEARVSAALTSEVLAATDRYFGEELRAELVRRMKDAALAVLAREGEARALEVAATIDVISRCGLVTDPPRDVPFLRGFFEKALAVMAGSSGGRLRIPVPRVAPTAAGEPAAADAPAATP